MAHKSHRKHLKHAHAHAEHPIEAEGQSLREMAGEVVQLAVDAVKAAPHAIVERVMRRPRAVIEKLSGKYGKTSKSKPKAKAPAKAK
jgi:hypothetical protein